MPEPSDAPERQDKPEEPAAPAVEADKAPEQESPEFFSDKFDPASLPDELRPAYNQMRGVFTQRTQDIGKRNREQILESVLQDPDFQKQALEQWGLELEGEDTEDEFLDPYEELRGELETLKGSLTQREQAEQQAQYAEQMNTYIDGQIEDLEKNLGHKLSDKEAHIIGNLALQNPDDQGLPNIRATYDEFAEVLAERHKSYVQGKREARQAPVGRSGSQKVNLKDVQERQRLLAETIEAEQD